MKLSEIINSVRDDLDDTVADYLWTSFALTRYINQAIDELCEKCFILQDHTTSITITGSSNISFDSTTNRISKSSGFIAAGFQGATTIVITDTSDNDGTFTLSSVDPADTYIVVVESLTTENNTSAVLTTTKAVTFLPTVESTDIYNTDNRIVKMIRAKLVSQSKPLTIIGKGALAYLDAEYGDWESASDGTPQVLCEDGFGDDKIKLHAPPDAADVLRFRVYRRPLVNLDTNRGSDVPEISAKYHRLLNNGVLYRAYGKRDAETFDERQSNKYYKQWIQEDIPEVRRIDLTRTIRDSVTAPPAGTIL